MNNFQDELIKRLEQDYKSAKARYECWIGKEDTPYKKEAIVYYRNAYYLFGSRNNLLYMGTINYRASRGLILCQLQTILKLQYYE